MRTVVPWRAGLASLLWTTIAVASCSGGGAQGGPSANGDGGGGSGHGAEGGSGSGSGSGSTGEASHGGGRDDGGGDGGGGVGGACGPEQSFASVGLTQYDQTTPTGNCGFPYPPDGMLAALSTDEYDNGPLGP